MFVVLRRRMMARNLIAFGWYGGKYSHLGWLLKLLQAGPSLLRAVRRFGCSSVES